MGLIGCPETSVAIYQPTPPNMPEERGPRVCRHLVDSLEGELACSKVSACTGEHKHRKELRSMSRMGIEPMNPVRAVEVSTHR